MGLCNVVNVDAGEVFEHRFLGVEAAEEAAVCSGQFIRTRLQEVAAEDEDWMEGDDGEVWLVGLDEV
jgi:uncharacterized lipoprotein NlpE involved in copper resistance